MLYNVFIKKSETSYLMNYCKEIDTMDILFRMATNCAAKHETYEEFFTFLIKYLCNGENAVEVIMENAYDNFVMRFSDLKKEQLERLSVIEDAMNDVFGVEISFDVRQERNSVLILLCEKRNLEKIAKNFHSHNLEIIKKTDDIEYQAIITTEDEKYYLFDISDSQKDFMRLPRVLPVYGAFDGVSRSSGYVVLDFGRKTFRPSFIDEKDRFIMEPAKHIDKIEIVVE